MGAIEEKGGKRFGLSPLVVWTSLIFSISSIMTGIRLKVIVIISLSFAGINMRLLIILDMEVVQVKRYTARESAVSLRAEVIPLVILDCQFGSGKKTRLKMITISETEKRGLNLWNRFVSFTHRKSIKTAMKDTVINTGSRLKARETVKRNNRINLRKVVIVGYLYTQIV